MARLYAAGYNAVAVVDDGRVETALEGHGVRVTASPVRGFHGKPALYRISATKGRNSPIWNSSRNAHTETACWPAPCDG